MADEVSFDVPSYENTFDDFESQYELDDLLHDLNKFVCKNKILKKSLETANTEKAILQNKVDDLLLESNLINCIKCETPIECDCEKLKKENNLLKAQVDDLAKCLAKFVKGTKNLKMMTGSQRNSDDKSGLGFVKQEDKTKPAPKKISRRIPHVPHYALTVALEDILS